MSIAEAFACGLSVVPSRLGAIAELVDESCTELINGGRSACEESDVLTSMNSYLIFHTKRISKYEEPDPLYGPASKEALKKCLREGRIVACEVAWAEVAVG